MEKEININLHCLPLGDQDPLEYKLFSFEISHQGAYLLRAHRWYGDPDDFDPAQWTGEKTSLGHSIAEVSYLKADVYNVDKADYNPFFEDGINLVHSGNDFYVVEDFDLYHPHITKHITAFFTKIS